MNKIEALRAKFEGLRIAMRKYESTDSVADWTTLSESLWDLKGDLAILAGQLETTKTTSFMALKAGFDIYEQAWRSKQDERNQRVNRRRERADKRATRACEKRGPIILGGGRADGNG